MSVKSLFRPGRAISGRIGAGGNQAKGGRLKMIKRQLGKSGLEVSALGLGCMRMSFGDAPIDTREEIIALIRSALEWCIRFFDTALVYGPDTNRDICREC